MADKKAVIGSATSTSVTEDVGVNGSGNLTAAGTISITGSTFSTSVIGAAGDLGTLTLTADGHYTYTVSDSAVQYLGAGTTKVDSFTLLNGTTKVVSFTINGANDAAIGAATVTDVTEDSASIVRAS